ncbi:hypothetical protein D3C81_2137180 [compost metagenome]
MWLDEAFHTVRLDWALIELGRMKGNIDRPTVEMIPTAEAEEPPKARAADLRHMPSRPMAAPAKPRTGAMIIHG